MSKIKFPPLFTEKPKLDGGRHISDYVQSRVSTKKKQATKSFSRRQKH